MQPRDPKKPLKRYDIPDAERWPGRSEPTPEVRPDLEAPSSEKGDVNPVATEYGGMVSKYFNEKRKIADLTEAEDTELFDYDGFLVMEQQSLEKLGNPVSAAEMKPTDVALTLGDLAGAMASRNPEIGANRTGDGETDAGTEQEYGDTKRIFMESSKRVFPSVTVDKADMGNELKLTAERLSREADPTGRTGMDLVMPDLTGKDIEKLMADDPKSLAAKIDKLLYQTGDLLQMRSRIGFDTGDPAQRGEISEASKWLYKLQLIRDGLQERMYDSKDVTASEADEIEKVRQSLGIEKKAEEEEAEEEMEAAEKKKVLETPEAAPLKELFKDEDALAVRLILLSEKVRRGSELKLASDKLISPDRARRYAIRLAYAELLPEEQDAMTETQFIGLMDAIENA